MTGFLGVGVGVGVRALEDLDAACDEGLFISIISYEGHRLEIGGELTLSNVHVSMFLAILILVRADVGVTLDINKGTTCEEKSTVSAISSSLQLFLLLLRGIEAKEEEREGT